MATRADHEATRSSSILPPEECRRVFDFEARRITGLSGEEFLRRYDAGEIVEDDETQEGREIMYLIMMIPLGRKVG